MGVKNTQGERDGKTYFLLDFISNFVEFLIPILKLTVLEKAALFITSIYFIIDNFMAIWILL
jgi:hypothetical protein